eukprot:scaffold302791_cov21-Tisochrysis_lutea.AAC.3
MEVVHQKSQCVRQGELNPLSDLRVSRRSGWASVWVPTTLTPAVTDWRIKRCLRIGVLQPLIGSMFGPWRRLTTDKSGEARTSIGALVAGAGALEGGVSGGSKGPAQIAVHFFFTLCLIGEFKAIRTPVHVPKSRTAESMEEAMEAAADIGRFPLIIRPAFTCGGTGGGIAYNVDEYKQIVKEGLDASMTNQVGVVLYCELVRFLRLRKVLPSTTFARLYLCRVLLNITQLCYTNSSYSLSIPFRASDIASPHAPARTGSHAVFVWWESCADSGGDLAHWLEGVRVGGDA